MLPAPLTLSRAPALHVPESRQAMQRRSWRALQGKWFLFNIPLSVFPEHFKALQNSTGVVTLPVNSSCSILGKPCSPLSLFAIVSKNLSSTEGICERQSRINHLPSSTDYIQAFLFLKCSFPISIHSFSKCTWSFFVPECSQCTAELRNSAASEKQSDTAPTSVPCLKNLLMREHLIPSLEEKN